MDSSGARRKIPRDRALGRIRTCDTGFRRAVLYPLSYEGGRAELTGSTCRRIVGGDPGHRSSAITFANASRLLSCTVKDVSPYFSRSPDSVLAISRGEPLSTDGMDSNRSSDRSGAY